MVSISSYDKLVLLYGWISLFCPFFSHFPKIQFIQLLNNKILGDALSFQSHLTFNREISSTYWFVFFPAFF